MADLSVEDRLPPFYRPLKSRAAVDALFETPAFEYSPKTSKAFCAAMRAALDFQGKRAPVLKALYKAEGFAPASVKTERDIEKIPFIFVSALKERDLTTLPYSKIVLELKSSGTSGQRSRMQLDKGSLMRVRRMAWKVFEGLGLTDLERAHDYICFTYDPEVAKDLGTAWTDKLLSGFTKKGEIFYTFRWSKAKNDFYFDLDGAVLAMKKFEDAGGLVRLVGFPAFALKLTEEFKSRFGRYPKLNPGSSVVTGGGWKTLADEAMDKKVYRKILADNLGIPVENVRDLFGMVEHGVPYVDCRLGNFHVPNYGRVIVRHPGTLEPLGYKERGLLQFITPYLTSYPSLSVLSSDFGLLLPRCACGLSGPVLEIKGRAGVTKLKGCAISAATML
ncbi:MAG: acyl-protein synthetase [Elusimicrobiota bacterium]|nr:acyl-protein synthetase [Elusimicrobiota bacterium]